MVRTLELVTQKKGGFWGWKSRSNRVNIRPTLCLVPSALPRWCPFHVQSPRRMISNMVTVHRHQEPNTPIL